MDTFKYIFVILAYRNSDDLIECIDSIKDKVPSNRVIVVNAYYDEATKEKIESIAKRFDCDFLNIENKGYSYGNNRGIEFARLHYQFDYIVVANPDIIINQFNDVEQNFDIIAPKIITASGKNQNPMTARKCGAARYFIYRGLKNNNKCLFVCGLAINKIIRSICTTINRNRKYYQIYAAHGSFVMISNNVVRTISPLYDENMFLFAEENVLAYKSNNRGFKTVYYPGIEIRHKEDGSMKISNISINNELKKSNIYFYERYIKND